MKAILSLVACCLGVCALQAQDDRFWLPAQINGQPARLMFDTGTTRTGLFPNAVERLGLEIDEAVPKPFSENGKVGVGMTVPTELRVLGVTVKIRLGIWPADLANYDVQHDGMLGWSHVSDNILLIDAATLTLKSIKTPPKDVLKWDQYPVLTNYEDLTLQIPGDGTNVLEVHIDTGMTMGLALSPGQWQKWSKLHPHTPKTLVCYSMMGAGNVVKEESWADEIALGSLVLTDVPVVEANPMQIAGASSNYAASIGMAALKRMHLIVDGMKNIAYVRPRRVPPVPYEYNRLGAVFTQAATAGSEFIAHVAFGTPASEAGIRDGDILLSLNNQDVVNAYASPEIAPLITRWQKPPGTKFSLTLMRGADVFKTNVVLRDILQPQKPRPVPGEIMTNEVSWFMQWGDAANLENTYDDAINNYTEVIRLDPKNAEAFAGRGVAFWSQGNHTRGWSDVNESIRLDPKLAVAYYYRAVMQPDLATSLADNNEAIRLKPDFAAAYNNRGNCYVMSDKLDLAAADFDKAIELDPALAQAFVRRGFVHKKRGEYGPAIKDCSEAIRVKPEDPDAFKLRGEIYLLEHNFTLAAADFEAAIKLDPKNPDSFNNLGTIFFEKNEFARALTNLDEALRLKPGMFEPLLNRGYVRLSLGDAEGAVADETQALSLKPGQPVALQHRGNAYIALKQYPEAIADFTEAIRLSPEDLGAYAGRSTAYLKSLDYTRAIADLTTIARVETNNTGVFNNRGYAYFALGKNREAIADFTESIRLNSNQPVAFGYRGDAYRKQKQYSRSLHDYEQALELDPKNPERYDVIATLRAVCPDPSIRDGKRAVAYARKECEITSWKSGNAIDTLALALAAAGDFAEAVKREKTVLSATQPDDFRKSAEKRVKLYEKKKPAGESDLYSPPADGAFAHSGNTTR